MLSRHRVCSEKRPRAADHRPNAEGSPAGAHAGSPLVHLERRDVPPLLRSSRSAGPPEHPPPPGLDVQHHQLPSHLIPSKAKPLRSPQTHNASTVQAAKPMRLKTVVSACLWLGGSSCRTPQPQTPQASFWLAPTKAQQVKFVASLWMPSTAAVRVGGGVQRRPAAVARCLADVIHTAAPKVHFEQAIPAFSREWPGRRCTRGCCLQSKRCHDVDRCRRCHSLLQQPSPPRPDHMAKRAEKIKVDRYPHVNLVPFILETTGRPGYHAKKFISNFMKDADNPSVVIRDTWSAVQSVLRSAISKQQLTASSSTPYL